MTLLELRDRLNELLADGVPPGARVMLEAGCCITDRVTLIDSADREGEPCKAVLIE